MLDKGKCDSGTLVKKHDSGISQQGKLNSNMLDEWKFDSGQSEPMFYLWIWKWLYGSKSETRLFRMFRS